MPRLPIRCGLSLPSRGVLFGLTNIDTILEAAALAEQSGVFESVWFGDSLIHKPRLESIVMLSAAAARTVKVRLGVICMASFPVRHPILLAIQWASLDQLSKGPGYPSEELIGLWLAHGPPQACAQLIQSWIDMGITTPVLRFTSRNQIGQIERFIADVLPLLRLQ